MCNKIFEELCFSLFDEIPKQCANCEYHKLNCCETSWCYMFRDKPENTQDCKQFKKSDK